MRKKLFILFFLPLFLFSQSAYCVGFDFKGLPLPEFLDAIFRHIVKRDFVISPAVLQKTESVSLSIADIPPDRIVSLVSDVLLVYGVSVVERGGVFYLDAVSSPNVQDGDSSVSPDSESVNPRSFADAVRGELPIDGRDIEIYRPKFQSPVTLAGIARFVGAEVVHDLKADSRGVPVVVLSGRPEIIEKALAAMAKVDVSPVSVKLRAAIIEITLSDEANYSFSGIFSLLSGKLGILIGDEAGAGSSITFKNTSITAILSAFDGDSRFRYLAEPSLKVMDGEEAKLVVGSEVPVRGSSTLDNNGNAHQSIEYKSAGVQLTVKPDIYADVVVARISQEISSFSVTTTSGIDSPTVLKRSASTVIDLREGEVVMLAGLDEGRESNSRSGFSFLPFSLSKSKTSSRSQIVLLVEMSR